MQILNCAPLKKWEFLVKKSVAVLFVTILSFSLIANGVFAADGSGTNTVSPNTTTAGSTGNTHTFTFTAAESMNSGGVTIATPSGWSAMQGISGTAGYTTVVSTGVIANVEDDAESILGWSAGNACSGGLTLDSAIFHEGAGSINCNTNNESSGDVFYKNISSENWSAYTAIGFWIRSGKALSAGNLRFAYDNNNNLASPIVRINLPAITANTWTYVTLTLSGTRTSILSYGLNINNNSTLDNTTINTDDFLLGPGSPTFTSGVINVRLLTLTSGQTITATYGSGGGTSGATAPSTGRISTFTTQTRVSDSGTLTDITIPPTITVNNPVPTTTSISPTSTFAGGVGFAIAVNGTNFNASSTVNWNGLARTTIFASSTQISASINAADIATAGTAAVTVVNPTPGGGTSNSQTFTINNPVPTTTSISPSTKNAGDPGFTLTVNGTNFVSTSVVRLNGIDKTTTFASSTQVTAVILASDITSSGTSTVAVFNPAPGGGVSNSAIFTVAPVATQFVILPPGNGTAGVPVTVTIQAQKSDGSLDANYNNGVTLVKSGSATGGGLVAVTNGVGTSTISDTLAETVHLSLSDTQGTGLAVSSTQDIIFSAGAVNKFVLNDPGDMNAKTRLGYVVTRKDQYNNMVTSGASSVYLYTSSTSSAHRFYDDSVGGNIITSLNIGSGSSTGQFWYYEEPPGSYTITASDNASTPDGNSGIQDGTDSVMVFPVATKFVIISATSTSVDTPLAVTIQAQKPDNSVDTNYNNGVTLAASGSATGDGLVTITNGVGTKQISNTVAETIHFSLSDSESTGLDISSTADVVFDVGAVAQFTLSHPSSTGAGVTAGYVLTRADQFGNLVISGTSTAYLYSSSSGVNKKFYDASSGGNIVTSVSVSNGTSTAQFWYYDDALGIWTITASDSSTTPDGNTGINDAVDSLTVTAGPASQFLLNDPGNMTANTRLGYTVTRKDQFGNLTTSGTNNVFLYSNSSGTSMAFYAASSGGSPITSIDIGSGQSSANFWYFDSQVGAWTITASDSASSPDGTTGIDDATDSVTVNAAPIVATRFVILPPTNGTVDNPITITIQAQDNGGSVDTTYNGEVTLNTTGSASGGGVVAITNGIGTVQISDHTAESINLSLTDSQGTGLNTSSTQSVTFAAGAVDQFILNNPGDMAAGTRLGYTVTRKDQYGNLVTSGATTVYLYSSSLGTHRFYDASTAGSVITSINITNGQSSAQVWYYDEKSGSWNVIASDSTPSADGATGIIDAVQAVNVTPGAVYQFIIDDPGNMTAGTRLGYSLTRKDQFDNLVTSGITLAYLYTTSSGTSTAFYDAASAGSQITFAVFNNGLSSANFWYFDNTPGVWNITVSDNATAPNGNTGIIDAVDTVTVSLAPIVATKFVIQPVSDTQINSPATVTIRAEDNNGNLDATINNSVTLLVSGAATGGGVVTISNGIGTATINDSTAETVNLSLVDSGSTGLNVSSVKTIDFVSQLVVPAGVHVAGGGLSFAGIMAKPLLGVSLSGTIFPGGKVRAIAIAPSVTATAQSATASDSGSFNLNFGTTGQEAKSYGIVATDKENRSTQTKVFDRQLTGPKDYINVSGIMLSPTLGLISGTVRRGDSLGLIGYGIPNYILEVEIDGKLNTKLNASVNGDGSYKVLISTAGMSLGSHTVRIRQVNPNNIRSDFAPQKVFTISNLLVPKVDFNTDGKVNVQDWSIFLSRWTSQDPNVRILDDLNGDGKVDVSDFSIFARTLQVGQ